MLVNILWRFMKIPSTVLKLQSWRDFVLEIATCKVQRGITQKVQIQELWFLRSAWHLMLVNIYMKFHEGTLTGFWVTERTRPYRKIYYFQFQRAITPKIRNPELQFLRSALRLMFLSYRADTILWQTDGQTTRAKTICLPTLRGET